MSTLTLLILVLPMLTANHSPQCGTPVQPRSRITYFLRAMLRSMEETLPEPSALIALHLASQHDRAREEQILQQLKENVIENGTEFSLGAAAWHTMALLSSCNDTLNVVVGDQQVNLVALLREKLEMDIAHVAGNGRPLPDFHQISLAILALCKASVCLPCKTIENIFSSAVQLSIQEEIAYPVDTLSIAALGLRCMNFENCVCHTSMMESALRSVLARILANVHCDGTIGDLNTTGLAVQALTANHDLLSPGSWDCRRSVANLLQGISNGSFNNPQAASLVIPSLENRTLLDIDKLNCSRDTDVLPLIFRKGLIADNSTPPTPTPTHTSHTRPLIFPTDKLITNSTRKPTTFIRVNYTVMDTVFNMFNHWLLLNVPLGSSVLDIMEEAERLSPGQFRFDHIQTPWGPLITSINGLTSDFFMTQWHFITGQDGPIKDLEEYVPSNGDKILAIFTYRLIGNE